MMLATLVLRQSAFCCYKLNHFTTMLATLVLRQSAFWHGLASKFIGYRMTKGPTGN